MERKEFQFKLLDGVDYIFTERNREDINYMVFQDKLRTHKIKFAEKNITDEALKDAIIIQQMDKVYSGYQVQEYLEANPDEMRKLIYQSFKIKNPEIEFDKFEKLIEDKLCIKILNMINELEKIDPTTDAELKSLLKVNQETLEFIKKNQPGVYEAMQRNVKKNLEKI